MSQLCNIHLKPCSNLLYVHQEILPATRKKLPPKALFKRIKDVSKREEKRTADILKDADFLVPNKNLMLKRVSNECSLCYGNA